MNYLIRYWVLMFCLLQLNLAVAQSYAIPDPAFRAHLIANYPDVMAPNQELDIAKAGVFPGDFYCYEKSIRNLDGIQFFKSITALNCFRNKLETLPDLSSLTQLISIQAFENQIRVVPSFNKLKSLKYLNLGDNQLKGFPLIDSLQNLTDIILYRNLLTSVPDLSNLPRLENLECYENKITVIGKLPASLKNLWFGDNFLTDFPDISLAKGLTGIAAYTNRLTAVPDLTSYPLLTNLNLGTNQLKTAPLGLSTLTSLASMTLDNNLLTSLPDLSGLTQLKSCKLENNELSFEDLLPSTTHPYFTSWSITPQDSLVLPKTFKGTEKAALRITLPVDSLSSHLTFSWYQEGRLKTQTSRPVLEIASLSKIDNGKYYCRVTSSNAALANFFRTSQAFTISVIPAAEKEADMALTPNGDGKDDELFFEKIGKLHIYDSQGKLLEQLQAPCYWNGTMASGKELGTGYYIIQLNDEQPYRVTIIR